MEDSAMQNTADRHGVCHHESHDLKGNDSVESRAGSNVDETESAGNTAGEDDSIGGNLSLGIDTRNPLRKWEAIITGESKGLTCGRGIERNVGCDDYEQDEYNHGVDYWGASSFTEDVDDGVIGRIVYRIFHAGYGEEVGDESDDGDESVGCI